MCSLCPLCKWNREPYVNYNCSWYQLATCPWAPYFLLNISLEPPAQYLVRLSMAALHNPFLWFLKMKTISSTTPIYLIPNTFIKTNRQKLKIHCRPFYVPLIYPLCSFLRPLCVGWYLPKLQMVLDIIHTFLTSLYLY